MTKNARRALWIAALVVLIASFMLLVMTNAPRSSPVIETTVIVPTVISP
jgi:hypothetical protein